MRYSGESLWKLSLAELAQRCKEIGHDTNSNVDPELQAEARRLYGGWMDAFSIDKHEDGAAERQAALTLALRKRTIEILVKSGQWAEV